MSFPSGEQKIGNPSKQALEQAKAFFEPQLQKLGLSEEQIHSYDLEQLETALTTINDCMSSPESFGVFRFAFSATLPILITKGTSEAHIEIGILPILLERKKAILERIKAIQASERQIAGAYVGRNPSAFVTGSANIIIHSYNSNLEEETFKEDEDNAKDNGMKTDSAVIQIRAQIEQIERLRGRLIELIPSEEALKALEKLREPTTIGSYIDDINFSMLLTFIKVSGRLKNPRTRKSNRSELSGNEAAQLLLDELSKVEMKISPNLSHDEEFELKQNLSRIADQISLRISRLTNLFRSLFNPAMSCDELVKNMVTKIGHKEYKDEAEMHLAVVSQLVEQLKQESTRLSIEELDVLSGTTKAAVGVMTEIEERRLVVEKLVRQDRTQRRLTIFTVIIYIALVISVMIACILQGARFQTGIVAMETLKLPLIGIPWPVIVWSLIGSFAAMIHRFNRMPIYDFGDAVKWLLTRPVQGAVLGSAFYLVLMAGLFLLTGGATKDPSGVSKIKDEVVLVLSFLVGFSDKFADSVFNTLVETYSREKAAKGSEEKED